MDAIMVFTSKSPEQIVELGGSGHWNLTPSRVAKMRYVVCTFCDTPQEDTFEAVKGRGPRGEAFFIGKISGLRPSYVENGRQRYVIEFSEYALVSVPDLWDGSRNPVRYIDEEWFAGKGIDFQNLDFKAMPTPAEPPEPKRSVKPLTIVEAKEGLAVHFDVPIDQIQITISG